VGRVSGTHRAWYAHITLAMLALALWVPETRRTSCDLLILVKHTAKAVNSPDADNVGARSYG
jgi:hypothetical protein